MKLTVSYDGTAFHGWQVQPGLVTIQGELERVFAEMSRRPANIAGSGRTDVHRISIASPKE